MMNILFTKHSSHAVYDEIVDIARYEMSVFFDRSSLNLVLRVPLVRCHFAFQPSVVVIVCEMVVLVLIVISEE